MIVVKDMVDDVVGDAVIDLMGGGYMSAPQSQQWNMYIMDVHNEKRHAVHIEDVTTCDLYFGYYQYFAYHYFKQIFMIYIYACYILD